jgi:hypothetical protein
MLRKLKIWFKGLFTKPTIVPTKRSQPTIHEFELPFGVEAIHLSQSSLDKRTHFKPGETYRVGEMVVTVHADKASMLAAVAEVEARRLAKEAKMRDKAIDIMLMTPEQLEQFQLNEWLSKRSVKESAVRSIIGPLLGRKDKQLPPPEEPPSGDKSERFEKLMDKVEDKETVN